MADDPSLQDIFARAAGMAESMDAVLALLLMAKLVHVERLSLVEPDLAMVELSGEAIERGLASLTEAMTIAQQAQHHARKRSVDNTRESAAPSLSSLWQALKDFALPPTSTPQSKTGK